LTTKVLLIIVILTMQTITSVTSKGQVVIPKIIRDQFNIKAFSKVKFSIQDQKIILEPTPVIDEMFGFFAKRTKKKLTKKVQKQIIKQARAKKFKSK